MDSFDFDFTSEQKTEDLKQAANDLFMIFTNLKEAGFTDEQAMKMIATMFKN